MGLVIVERVRGVEPLSLAWKAKVIPIYDTRKGLQKEINLLYRYCRGAENRTQAVRSQSARTTIIRHPVYKTILTEKIDIVKGKILC